MARGGRLILVLEVRFHPLDLDLIAYMGGLVLERRPSNGIVFQKLAVQAVDKCMRGHPDSVVRVEHRRSLRLKQIHSQISRRTQGEAQSEPLVGSEVAVPQGQIHPETALRTGTKALAAMRKIISRVVGVPYHFKSHEIGMDITEKRLPVWRIGKPSVLQDRGGIGCSARLQGHPASEQPTYANDSFSFHRFYISTFSNRKGLLKFIFISVQSFSSAKILFFGGLRKYFC
jgi:hypothetical protein